MPASLAPQNNQFSISGIAIRRHIATIMLTLAVIIIGLFFFSTIQVDLLPSITYPRIGIRVSTNGITPEIAVQEITRPLEEAMSAVKDVELVYSRTRENRISVDLFFRVGGNIDQAFNDATTALNQARDRLPDSINNPRLFKFDPAQSPIYQFAVTSDMRDSLDLRVFTETELARELSVIPGVAMVDVAGGVEEEVRVQIDLDRLQALGIGLNEVLTKIRNANQDIAGGRLLGENDEPLTRIVGKFDNAGSLNYISFAVPNSSRRVYLREFAEVIDGGEEQRVLVYLNGTPAVKVNIQKQPSANTIEVIEDVKNKLEQLKEGKTIPEDITILPTRDESVFIRNSINNVIFSGVVGTVLAAIAVLLFLGSVRQTLIIVISIPLATLTAVIMMKISGFSLNVFSLGGLALGVGIVVDNSIVMLETMIENIETIPKKKLPVKFLFVAQGKIDSQPIIAACIDSAKKVESALIASTSTNLVVILPFLMIGGLISLLFRELILTISFAVTASIVIALTIVPMLTSRLFAIPFSSNLKNFLFIKCFNQAFQRASFVYGQFLAFLLRFRLFFVIAIFIILGTTSHQLFAQLPQEILPRINTGQVNLWASFPPNTTLATNKQVMQIVDRIILQQPETDYAFTTSGGFLFSNSTIENVLRASSNITLKANTDVEAYITKVQEELRKLNLVNTRLSLYPGRVRGLNLTNSPVREDVDIILQGNDQDLLERTGQEIVKILDEKATLVNFRPDSDRRQPEVIIRPDLLRLADFDLSVNDITDSLRTTVSGLVVSQLQRGERLVDIRVQLNPQQVKDASTLLDVPLFTSNNSLIRLGEVATIDYGQAPSEIKRINQRQVFIIAGSLAENIKLTPALAEIEEILQTIDIPEGIRILSSIAQENNDRLQSSFPILGGLAAFLVFVVMAVQYNSLIDPLVIMFTLPLALSGGIIGLYVTQTPIGATVIVGAVLLVGIVVNNAIVMVELANQIYNRQIRDSRIKKASRYVAIFQAAQSRLRPILMTTITTVLGIYPLSLGIGEGSEFLQPLGIVVFWGLSLATLLTLFLIPCLYLLLHQPFNFSCSQIIFINEQKDHTQESINKIAS